MKQKIMILGASILQLPAIQKAKKMGITTIVVDQDKDAIGAKEADVFLSISTIDSKKALEAAQKYKINGIMTLASDMPMRTVARVSQALGLTGIDEKTAICATDKVEMREVLRKYGIPIPQFYYTDDYQEYLKIVKCFQNKFIVKPSDNSGSRGIYLVDKQENIKKAFEYSQSHSHEGTVLVEEYMEGPEVSVEALTIEGETTVIAITDKLTTGAPYFVEMGHSQPSIFPKSIQEAIIKTTLLTIEAIGIKNGPSHTEIKITNEGPKVVEIGARLGGDNITSYLVPLSTGIDMIESCIKIALGEKTNIKRLFNKGAAIRYLNPRKGKVIGISGVEEAKQTRGIKNLTIRLKTGDFISEINHSNARIGYAIAQDETVSQAVIDCEKAIKKIKICLKEDNQ